MQQPGFGMETELSTALLLEEWPCVSLVWCLEELWDDAEVSSTCLTCYKTHTPKPKPC